MSRVRLNGWSCTLSPPAVGEKETERWEGQQISHIFDIVFPRYLFRFHFSISSVYIVEASSMVKQLPHYMLALAWKQFKALKCCEYQGTSLAAGRNNWRHYLNQHISTNMFQCWPLRAIFDSVIVWGVAHHLVCVTYTHNAPMIIGNHIKA